MNRRTVFVLVVALLAFGTGCVELEVPPSPGLALYRSPWVQQIGDFHVDLAGGNGRYTIAAFRNGMDTYLGTFGYAFTYNSADKRWSSEFGMRYGLGQFVDDTGARYDLSSLLDGAEVPGTHWVKLSVNVIRSRGGRRYEFDPLTSELRTIRQMHLDWPRLNVSADLVEQCLYESVCEDLFVITRNAGDQITGITSRDRAATIDWNGAHISSFRQSGDVEAGRAGFSFEHDYGLLEAVVNPAGERVEIAYRHRRVARVTQIGEGNPTYAFQYVMSQGLRAVSVTDPRGGERTVTYADDLTVVSEQNQEGETWSFTWVDKELSSRTRPTGETTAWLRAGDTLTETQPSGNVITTTYLPSAVNNLNYRAYPIAYREDSVGLIEDRSYDAQGRVTSISEAEGYTEEFGYNVGVQSGTSVTWVGIHAETDPLYTGFINHGWHGHPEWVYIGNQQLITTDRFRVYSQAGDLVNGDELEDPEGPGRPGVNANLWDHNRHLLEKSLSFGSMWETVYFDNRFDGQLTEVTRAYGNRTSFNYDALGRVISQCEPVDGIDQCTTFEYDLSSNTVLTTRGDGSTETRIYDLADREIAVLYSKLGSADMSVTTHFNNGRIDWKRDSAYGMEKELYSYNAAGALSAIDFPDGKRMEADSDLRGRVAELRYRVPDGGGGFEPILTLGFGYDLENRRTQIYEDGALLVEDTYESGRIDQRWTANGSTKYWYYETSLFGGMLQETYTVMAGGYAESYVLTKSDEIKVLTQLTGLATGPIVDLEELHRILDVDWNAGTGTYVTGWGDDPDDPFWPELRYSRDALGNITDVWSESGTSTHPTSTVTWNTEHNRVVSAVYDGQTIDYVYNGAGEVVERGGVAVARNAMGAVISYGSWWAEKDTRGRFVSLAGVPRVFGGRMEADGSGEPTAMDLHTARIELGVGANTHYFKYYDMRNNLQRIDDDSGTPLVLYRYDPYGVSDVYGIPPGLPERTFAQGLTVGDGLVLTGRRVLDPACKCYWSNDPIFNSLNQVAYTANPIALWDPTGEITVTIHLGHLVDVEFDIDRTPVGEEPSFHACGQGYTISLLIPAFLLPQQLRQRRKKRLQRIAAGRLPTS